MNEYVISREKISIMSFNQQVYAAQKLGPFAAPKKTVAEWRLNHDLLRGTVSDYTVY